MRATKKRLTLALKAPEQEADGSENKALPAGTAGEVIGLGIINHLCTIINDFHKDRCTAECYDYGSEIHGHSLLFGWLGYRNV